MKKGLLLNIDKLVWAKIDEGGYESKKYKFKPERKKGIKILGINYIYKIKPAKWVNLHSIDESTVSEEEVRKDYFLIDNTAIVKPHVYMKFQDGTDYTEFFDSVEDAETFFRIINKLLPNSVQCK